MRRTKNPLDRAIHAACRAFLPTVDPAAAHKAVAGGDEGLAALCDRRAREAAARFEETLATRPEGPGDQPKSDPSVGRRFELAFHDAVRERVRDLIACRPPPTPPDLDVGLSGTLEGDDAAPRRRRGSRIFQHVMCGTVNSMSGTYVDDFYLFDDRAKSRWALWACVDASDGGDEYESKGGGYAWSAVAWCPRGELEDRLAAIYLMRAILEERRDAWGNGRYACATGSGLLSDDEVRMLQDEVYEGRTKW